MREDWVECELKEVVTYSKGKKPAVLSKVITENLKVPYINIKAFEKGIFDEYTDGLKCNLCKTGDLLMVWDGARAGLTGKAKTGAVGSTLMKIEPLNEIVNREYLYYFLLSKFTLLNTNPRGVGIPHVEPNLLWNSKFKIFNLAIQKAIVKKIEELFSSLDSGIADLKKAQEQLVIYRQAVLKKAFEGELTNSVMRKEELSSLSTKIGDGLHGTPKYDEHGSYFFINGNNLNNGKIHIKPETKKVNEEEYLKYQKDLNDKTVFVSINGTIGNTAFYNNEPVILGKSACYINLKSEMDKKYLRFNFLSSEFINYALKNATGSTIKNVGLKTMRDYLVPLPENKQEQSKIVREIESRLSVCDKVEESLKESLEKAKALRQSILKKAFEGKLLSAEELAKCKADQDYEPASVLLEKIKKEKKKNCFG